ncbi:MAG: zinc-dependent metalloprotease, partial [Gemmatimonadetes bacterium]|nr:zinc-dependent metalloprotease [Gemmatimonadota bacterium]
RWWNQAFEAAGFIDGFRMELLPEGVSTHDIRYNVVNWVHRSTRGWSTGGSVTDPRTGEILKGVVTLGSLRIRQDYMIAEGLLAPYTNGDETPPELAEWALARIRQLSAHEIGHTLGLGHNYYDSEAGRISVMDYPHPLITLANGRLDPSQVYDTDIGEWDKVAITYGYAEFAPGTDEQARLRSILDEAMAQDVLYMTNQDTEAHGRVDQWSNGTDGAAELERMMDVRRFALDRFGERALPGGRPLAQLEEVLVPLYLHHRYQVEAAASMLGGLHYGYAMRGDGRDPVAWVDGRQQRAALAALLRTIRPGELALPRPVLERIPPRPPGYGRTRELFPRWTGSAFDALSPAAVAADHTIAQMLDPERAARLVEQSVVDPSLPSLGEVIAALVGATDGGGAASPYEAEIQRTVQRVLAERLMALAEGAPMPQVRAEASAQLERMQHRMERATETLAEGEGNAIDADAAHRRLLARDIERVLDRPAEPWALPRPAEAPPGAPIGDPALDWLGTGGGGWWERLGPSGLRPGMGWLQQVAPACTLEEVFP